jgi:hypothetical protein
MKLSSIVFEKHKDSDDLDNILIKKTIESKLEFFK